MSLPIGCPKLSQALQESPELTDISSDWQADGMMAYINVDRDSASRLGILNECH